MWLIAAFAAVIGLYAHHAIKASLSIDGLRYFWLDDDQMISMRYARNLAEGQGLVWNPGERVEGYSNFGWVLVMAAVHLLPLPDRLMPLGVTGVSLLVCLGVVALAARLLERLQPQLLAITLPVLLLCIVTCTDIMIWATSGFETVAVTLLHLWVVLGAIERRRLDWKLLLPLALIPVVRSDGMHIWVGDALLLLWLSEDRKRTSRLLLLSVIPFAAHLAFRLIYYGDLLPNTYYLKVSGLDGRWPRGVRYVRGFVQRYWLLLMFAAASAASVWRHDVRARSLLTSVAPPVLFSIQVGGDLFQPFRFFGHVMPELMVWAVLGGTHLVVGSIARAAWLGAIAVFLVPLNAPLSQIAPVGSNGDPYDQIVVAAQLRKNASPESSVAVVPAGIVPYFTRLKAYDLLGKTDAHVAHLPPQGGALIGHGKMDTEYTLGKRPDYVVSCRPRQVARTVAPLPPEGTADYVWRLLASPAFRQKWESNPLPDPYLLERTAVYVASDSPEMARIKTWYGVVLAP